jgi:hypothetical protein
MKTPEQVSMAEVVDAVRQFREKCVLKDDDLHCGTCGTAIAEKMAYLSIHSSDVFHELCTGVGRVLRVMIPYCPKCESEPEERGCIHEPMLGALLRSAHGIFN